MPAKDHYHDIVKRALIKDGWTIIRDQYPIRIGLKRIWIDLSVGKATGSVVFIEVKDYKNTQSIELLRDTVGQYILYRAALKYAKLSDYPLYLAVSQNIFEDIFSTPIGKVVIEDTEMNILIFDPKEESVKQWLPFKK